MPPASRLLVFIPSIATQEVRGAENANPLQFAETSTSVTRGLDHGGEYGKGEDWVYIASLPYSSGLRA